MEYKPAVMRVVYQDTSDSGRPEAIPARGKAEKASELLSERYPHHRIDIGEYLILGALIRIPHPNQLEIIGENIDRIRSLASLLSLPLPKKKDYRDFSWPDY